MLSFFRREPPIADLWQWFQANCNRLKAATPADSAVFKQMTQNLRRIDPGLTYTLREGDPMVLEISADGNPELIELVKSVVEQAPSVNGWEIVPFRQPRQEPISITALNVDLTADNLKFELEEAEGDKPDLTIYIPGLTDEHYVHLSQCAVLVAESLIGELALMDRFHEVNFDALDHEEDAELPPLRSLRSAVSWA